jgi:hypothetical protein
MAQVRKGAGAKMDGLQVPNRTLRVEDELWHAFGEKLRKDPQPALRSRAAVLRALMDFCTAYPGHMEALLRDLGDLGDIRTMLDGYGKDSHESEEE